MCWEFCRVHHPKRQYGSGKKILYGISWWKRKKSRRLIELRILYLIWVLGAPYYQGGLIGWVGEVQTLKSILPPKNPVRSDISSLIAGFQRLWSDVFGPQARHVQPLSLIRLSSRVPEAFPGYVRPLDRTCPTQPNFSAAKSQTGHIRSPSQVLEKLVEHVWPRPRHVRVSDTPTARFSWGAINGPPRLSSSEELSIHIANTLRHSLELPTSLLQALFKFKLPRRDLSLTLEWPTRSSYQSLHRRSSCVHFS
jgi:hypothetical protein